MSIQDLATRIEQGLQPFNFQRMPQVAPLGGQVAHATLHALWKLKTFNINRGVALVETDAATLPEPLANFATRVSGPLGKQIGYFPFFYPLGLQVVIVGRGILVSQEALKKGLDLLNNQTVLVQSIHAVDTEARDSVSVRTWAQFATGKFQDAIEAAIREHVQAPAAV